MATLIRVPRLYPEMEEATVGRWVIGEGGAVTPRTPIVEIITDKVSYEVEAPEDADGAALLVACAAEKSVVPVESILAILGRPGEEDLPDWRAENARAAERRKAELSPASSAPAPSTSAAAPATAPAAAPIPGEIRATPAARRAAKAAGLTLEQVASVAAGSTITEADVARYLEQQ